MKLREERKTNTIDEMVIRLDRELDLEFQHIETISVMASLVEAREHRVSKTVVELMELEIENKQFTNSFI